MICVFAMHLACLFSAASHACDLKITPRRLASCQCLNSMLANSKRDDLRIAAHTCRKMYGQWTKLVPDSVNSNEALARKRVFVHALPHAGPCKHMLGLACTHACMLLNQSMQQAAAFLCTWACAMHALHFQYCFCLNKRRPFVV